MRPMFVRLAQMKAEIPPFYTPSQVASQVRLIARSTALGGRVRRVQEPDPVWMDEDARHARIEDGR